MAGEEQERQFGEENSLETAQVLQLQTGHLTMFVPKSAWLPTGLAHERILRLMRKFIMLGLLFFCMTALKRWVVSGKLT